MPYCPKCDMEFVEGITVCTDCGGPLVDKDVWFAEKETREAAERAEREERMRKLQEQMEEEGEAQEKAPELVTITRKGARTMNTLAVGGGACIAAALLWAGVVNLPMAGASKVIFQTAITALGLGFLFIGWKTQGSIAEALKKADAEEKRSADVLDWFRKNWTAESIDEKLLAEDPTLEGADLDFKRSAYISDLLITGQDLPDQSYADYLADKIYQELYSE